MVKRLPGVDRLRPGLRVVQAGVRVRAGVDRVSSVPSRLSVCRNARPAWHRRTRPATRDYSRSENWHPRTLAPLATGGVSTAGRRGVGAGSARGCLSPRRWHLCRAVVRRQERHPHLPRRRHHYPCETSDEREAPMTTDTLDVEQRALALPEQARSLVVCDDLTYQQAGGFLLRIKAVRHELDATFDPIVDKAHKTWKEALAQKKRHEYPLALAENVVKGRMAAYHAQQERITAEE